MEVCEAFGNKYELCAKWSLSCDTGIKELLELYFLLMKFKASHTIVDLIAKVIIPRHVRRRLD